ncbi:MAG: 2-nitropropane dioxygenase [Actinomycetales bacterium]|nr:2-nitropropane dioxygenase [Actinomycetales bacterium]
MTGTLADILGVEVPVVLGPFGGLSSVELTATVSELGGLGSYGLYGYDRDRIQSVVSDLRAATQRPFALNLWLETGDEAWAVDVSLDESVRPLAPLFAELGLTPPEAFPERFLPDLGEQIDAVMEARPRVVSFVYGVPPPDVIETAHRVGAAVLGTATTADEAVALAEGGVDAVIASGAEAAGHRVSFLLPPEDSLVGTIALVPQVVDVVDVPVIAAGGIADRRGVAAAFALGAQGVQVGTAFLTTRQSAAAASYRAAVRDAAAHDTILTRAMSGRLARGLPNLATRIIEAEGGMAPFPAQNWLTGQFRAQAARADRVDLLSLWAGQAAALSQTDEADDVFRELAAGLPEGR